jgi:pilus assembly protein Flp/PilA
MAEGHAGELVMKTLLACFLRDESGATAIEYALIAGGLSIVIVGAANALGTTLNTKYAAVNTALR